MSEENVETIRTFYEAYNRRDFDALPKPITRSSNSSRREISRQLEVRAEFALGWSRTPSSPK